VVTWSYSYRPEIWPALVTLGLVAYLGYYSWRRRDIAGATPFAIGCALGGFWILGVILEISAVSVPAQIFWNTYQALWQLPMAATMTCFILQFAGLDRWLKLRTYALLFLIPLLNAVASATNSAHHLVWTGFQLNGHLVPLHGRLFWFFNGYVYLLGLLNLSVLLWLALRSPRHRWPVAIIVSGQVLGRIGYTLDKMDTGWLGPGESALFTVGLVATAYAIAFLGFNVIDPVTAARTAVLQQMREGMFVLDPGGRILDVNPMAAAIVGIPEAGLRSRHVSEVLPLAAGPPGSAHEPEADHTEIVLGNPDPVRHYDVNVTPLSGRDGDLVGRLLLLHDVTEQKQTQARVLEQQEVVATLRERERLARELHDGIGQILGYAGMQAETALEWVRSGNRDKAATTLERLAGVAREAHADVRESILSLKADPLQGWSFIPTLGRYLEKFQAHHGIRTELSISGGVGDDTFEPAAAVQLLRVVQEALSNARKHGGAKNLKLTVDANGSRARITITDDGHGFDTGRLGGEDSSHYGLVFMRERLQQIGGSVEIDSKPGAGTVLKLDVPTRDHGRKTGESPSG